jgi:4-aminobutyrate aminotransferase / (S)-3-amino-2-methylpropionate transaminase
MPARVEESSVATEVPGPLSKAASKSLDAAFDTRAVHFVVDYDKSSGD